MKLSAIGSDYYEVKVNGLVVSQHTQWWKAAQEAVNREAANPGDIVTIKVDQEIRVESAAMPAPEPEPAPEPVPPPPPPAPDPAPPPSSGFTRILEWAGTAFNLAGYEVVGGATIDQGAMRVQSFASSQGDKGYKELGRGVHPIEFGKTYRYTWKMRLDPALAWSNQQKMKATRWVRLDGATPINVLTGYLGRNGFWPGEHGAGFICDQGAGSGDEGPVIFYNLDPVANPAVTGWQTYQIDQRVQSAPDARDGVMVLRVNGSQIGQLTGIRWFSGTIPLAAAWGGWGMFFYPQNANGFLWSKEVVIEVM